MRIRLKRERLAQELARKSLSLNNWGQRLGLSKGHLSLLLNGKRRYPNPATRRKLLEGLSLDFEDLFELEAPRGEKNSESSRAGKPVLSQPITAEGRGAADLSTIVTEWKHALRALLRRPALTVTALLTLALGIGAATVIFGVVEAVLLRPLPFDHPERLALVGSVRQSGGNLVYASRAEFLDLSEKKGVFEGVAATEPWVTDWTGQSEPRQLSAGSISTAFFRLLGVEPFWGRSFRPEECRPGAEAVVILSWEFFRTQLGGSEDRLGRPLQLDGQPHRIVGVMPRGFGLLNPGLSSLERKDVWLPMQLDPGRMTRHSGFTRVLARLQPGVTWERAQAQVAVLSSRLAKEHPEDYPREGFQLQVVPLQERIIGSTRPILTAFLGAVGLLLLLVCFNLATLQLARAETRQSELGLRLALGASRWQLLRHSLAEGTLLALAGSGLGLLSAAWGLDALRSLRWDLLPRLDEARLDGSVLAAALGAALASLLIFSLAPAWLSTGLLPQTRIGSLRATASRSHSRLRSALVVAEVALALLLLTGSGLMLRSFARLLSVDPGFDPDRVLTFRLVLGNQYAEGQPTLQFFERLQQRLEALPQVVSTGLVDRLPLHWTYSGPMTVDEGGQSEPREMELARRYVSGNYFSAMGIELLQGRLFEERDRSDMPPVAIIDGRLAQRLWPGESPLGKRLKRGSPDSPAPWADVVGVVRHVKHRGLETGSPEQVYFPLSQHPFGTRAMFVAVRGRGNDMDSLTADVRNLVWSLDRSLPLSELEPMRERLSESLSQRSFNTLLFSLFACFGLALGAVGILGVVSHSVSRRIREIGLRMALGARPSQILHWVLSRGMRLTLAGLLLGFLASLALTRSISSLLFGIDPLDLPTLVGSALFLALVSLGASYLPAHRASRVDPVISLRWE